MWRLFCHSLSFISSSFGASGRLCFVIMVFSQYLHLGIFYKYSSNLYVFFCSFFFSFRIKRQA